MNISYAKIVAKSITTEQLKRMVINAKDNITDWKKPSVVNLSATIGTSWNILTPWVFKEFLLNNIGHSHMVNLIREFGEYLPEELKPIIHKSPDSEIELVHQEPIFNVEETQEAEDDESN
jgi:hypothetical protein